MRSCSPSINGSRPGPTAPSMSTTAWLSLSVPDRPAMTRGDSPGQPDRQDPPGVHACLLPLQGCPPDREWVWIVPTHTMLSVVAEWNLLLEGSLPPPSSGCIFRQERLHRCPIMSPRRPAERASTEPLPSIPSHHVRMARLPPPTRTTTCLERPYNVKVEKGARRRIPAGARNGRPWSKDYADTVNLNGGFRKKC